MCSILYAIPNAVVPYIQLAICVSCIQIIACRNELSSPTAGEEVKPDNTAKIDEVYIESIRIILQLATEKEQLLSEISGKRECRIKI